MKLPPIEHLVETTSTNLYLRELQSKQFLENGFAVYADFQSAGRGQKGNSWYSTHGENLMFSTILFPHNIKASSQFIISQVISLAIKDILNTETSDITIKWPNDIYWREKKIVGILIENDIMDDHISQSIIGVGVNLNQTVSTNATPNFVSLKQITGKTYVIKDVLERILYRLQYYYKQMLSGKGIEDIREYYKQSLFRKEGRHLYSDGENTFYAEITDIEDSGLLILKTITGDIRKFAFKEISYIL